MDNRELVLAELVEYAAFAGAFSALPPQQIAEIRKLLAAVRASALQPAKPELKPVPKAE